MVRLLDVNVLIALAWPSHVHHSPAHVWFAGASDGGWATCPLTQCAFIRISSNPAIIPDAVSPSHALEHLAEIVRLPDHVFWPDDIQPIDRLRLESLLIVGHRQITDAYLLALAAHHKGCLATLDRSIANLIPDGSPLGSALEVIPTTG